MRHKNCNGCKALYVEQAGTPHCELGFKVCRDNRHVYVGGTPVELATYYPEDQNCPKPKTNKALVNIKLGGY